MYGLQAIDAANGWVISIAGIAIVFTGLVVLATLISKLEMILGYWDKATEIFKPAEPASDIQNAPAAPSFPEHEKEGSPSDGATLHLSKRQMEVAGYFELITERLGEPFSLPRLLEQAEKRGIANPHHHLDAFLSMNMIIECEDQEQRGFYTWRKNIRMIRSET